MDPRIVYEDVKKAFDGKVVLNGVSFKVNQGELAVLLGPNGSGKSTLFKMALGLVKPDSGRILINGLDASQNPLEARKLVGFIPEENILYESLKVGEYLEFIASIYGVKATNDRVESIIKLLGLNEYFDQFIGELSHGTKRKVLIASIMLREPPILILDELFTGLDPASARLVKTWLYRAAERGASILVSTHVLPVAEAVADRVIIIHKGRIVAEGKPHELKEIFGAKELEDIYLEVTGYSRELEQLTKALYE